MGPWDERSTGSSPTHLYLHSSIHHHPSQKRSVIPTLVNRAVKVVDKNYLYEVLCFLKKKFAQNWYSSREIEAVKQQMKGTWSQNDEEEEIRGIAVVPFCGSVTNWISRLLGRHNIKTVLPFFKNRTRFGISEGLFEFVHPRVGVSIKSHVAVGQPT